MQQKGSQVKKAETGLLLRQLRVSEFEKCNLNSAANFLCNQPPYDLMNLIILDGSVGYLTVVSHLS